MKTRFLLGGFCGIALLLLTAQVILPGGYIQAPSIANASLQACDALHLGSIAWDNTNNCITRCNSTTWVCLAANSAGLADGFISINDPVTAVASTGDIWVSGPTKSAMTVQDGTTVVPIAGGGTGTLTAKLSSAAAGGGTVFVTCTTACNAAINTTTACTVNTAAIPAATTLHYAITGACTTADVQNNVAIHFSQP